MSNINHEIQKIEEIVNQEVANIKKSEDKFRNKVNVHDNYKVYLWPKILYEIKFTPSGKKVEIVRQFYIVYNRCNDFSLYMYCTDCSFVMDDPIVSNDLIASNLSLREAITEGIQMYNASSEH